MGKRVKLPDIFGFREGLPKHFQPLYRQFSMTYDPCISVVRILHLWNTGIKTSISLTPNPTEVPTTHPLDLNLDLSGRGGDGLRRVGLEVRRRHRGQSKRVDDRQGVVWKRSYVQSGSKYYFFIIGGELSSCAINTKGLNETLQGIFTVCSVSRPPETREGPKVKEGRGKEWEGKVLMGVPEV